MVEKFPPEQATDGALTSVPEKATLVEPSQVPDSTKLAATKLLAAGELKAKAGAVLSTAKVPLAEGASDVFPAKSVAMPAGNEIPTVPFPEQPDKVTVRETVPLPETAFEHVAPPVVFKVTSPFTTLTVLRPTSSEKETE